MTAPTRTFGQVFGDLIREKRGQEGLTQRELAIRAFDDESKVRRIIELEGGQVRRPQAKTIDALRAYFGITASEMDACHQHGIFSPKEEAKFGLARSLLENLAMRFEHENPDASDSDLFGHLTAKAAELRGLKSRINQIEAVSDGLANQIAAANAALDEGSFTEADELLANLEELHQEERTLKEVRRQVQIRITRGDSALFQSLVAVAAGHYMKAADYLEPFDADEAALVLQDSAGRLYETQRRRTKGDFSGAISMAERALALSTEHTSPENRSERAFHLALIELSHARTLGNAGLQTATSAVDHAKQALAVGGEQITDHDWASCSIALANSLLLVAELEGNEIPRREAASVFRELLDSPRTQTLALHRCHLHNNLSAALRELSRTANDSERAELLRTSRTHLMRAIEFSSMEGVSDVWISAQHNLGGLLAEEARSLEGPQAAFARLQAIVAFQSSIELFPQEGFLARLGESQIALGRVLLDHAKTVRPELREVYLFRCIAANESAASVFSSEEDAIKRSEAQFHTAMAFLAHSEVAKDAQIAVSDLERACEYFDKALPGFSTPEAKVHREMCTSARQYAGELLASRG